MSDNVTFTRVVFRNFKAFGSFSLTLRALNILVGPNNSGKSTILNAFRVLVAGITRAKAKNADMVDGPDGDVYGHLVPIEGLPISLENVHTNYDASKPTTVKFHLSNRNSLMLFFPPDGRPILIPERESGSARSASTFRREFPVEVGFVPVLGPVEHREELVQPRTVQRGLVTHRASRHFRNYWFHFPDRFDEFSNLVKSTWPGMEVQRPELVDHNVLGMFCAEDRIDRELYWAGFGFQVWCQLLTHVVRSSDANILVVDEPDIYLHPDLQRQILSVLRYAGPDILLATHSTEIVAEADPPDILVIDKTKKSAQRLKDSEGVQAAIEILGSSQNITLTQLARTRRVLFVEGHDYKILARFARVLGLHEVANQSDFAVVPVGGFEQWESVRAVAWGIEKTLGTALVLGAVFDRDYRCDEEIDDIKTKLAERLSLAYIHSRKELENYLLVPIVLNRAIRAGALERARRTGGTVAALPAAEDLLIEITDDTHDELQSQYISWRLKYFKSSPLDSATITREAIGKFNESWQSIDTRLTVVPGKNTLARLNDRLQEELGFGLTSAAIIRHFRSDDVPRDLYILLKQINRFRRLSM